MRVRPIRNDDDHLQALADIDRLWGAPPGTEDADDLEVLVTLVDAYEAQHHPIDPPDPVDALKFRMDQEDLSRADLEPLLGSRARVSEILSRKRPMTLGMIRRVHEALHIPAEILIRET